MVDSRRDIESAPGVSHGMEHPVLRFSKSSAPPGPECRLSLLQDVALAGRLGDAAKLKPAAIELVIARCRLVMSE